jgi:glucokinase
LQSSFELAHQRVYACLRSTDPQTQPQLAQTTGLSLPAVINAIKRLEAKGLIDSSGEKRGNGRPSKCYRAAPERHQILAIDLGGTRVRAGVFDLHGVQHTELETIGLRELAHMKRPQCLNYLRDLVAQFPNVKRIGICAPGIVTPQQHLERSWLFGMRTLNHTELEQALCKPVLLENDARSAAWGEYRRGGGSHDFAFLIFAFGIGAGIVSGGRLLRGARGAAGELSYLPPRTEDLGVKPRIGALAYEFFERLQEASPTPEAPDWKTQVFQKAASGNKSAKRAVQSAVQHLGLAISSLLTVIDPQTIILREEFPHTRELVLEPLRDMLETIGLTAPLEISALGQNAGMIGVALLAAEALEQELLYGNDDARLSAEP